MSRPINMPQVGQDLESAVIVEWHVQVGDEIKKGDTIATVESDKASFEVESFESGVVEKLLYNPGDEAKVFEPIAFLSGGEILTQNTAVNDEPKESKIIQKTVPQNTHQELIKNKIFSTPSARRVAREHDVDLKLVTSSGPHGRIKRDDVLDFVEQNKSQKPPEPQPLQQADSDQVIPFNKMRQKIADRLVAAKQTIPHFYLFMDVDMTPALAWRTAFNQTAAHKISINDLIVFATAQALLKYPKMNCHVEADKMIVKKEINIGIAVSVDNGLLVPVVSHADQKNIQEISSLSKELALNAQKGVLKFNGLGTFTISNLGMYGVSKFIPIINPPEAAILGVGGVRNQLVPLADNSFGVREKIELTLACDHRAVDGAYAAQFLNQIKENLELF